jgi:uncharacterized RDD family membrane protein YckC
VTSTVATLSATIGQRAGAAAMDIAIVSIVAGPLLLISWTTPNDRESIVFSSLAIVIAVIYSSAEVIGNSSPGKMRLKQRVLTLDFRCPRLRKRLNRWILKNLFLLAVAFPASVHLIGHLFVQFGMPPLALNDPTLSINLVIDLIHWIFWPIAVYQLLDILCVGLPGRRALHDRFSGTQVITMPRARGFEISVTRS